MYLRLQLQLALSRGERNTASDKSLAAAAASHRWQC